uniref:SodB n=1 Tax=Arundo donax TaxID=35708 RepID=A0A0A9EB40_ARUDO
MDCHCCKLLLSVPLECIHKAGW